MCATLLGILLCFTLVASGESNDEVKDSAVQMMDAPSSSSSDLLLPIFSCWLGVSLAFFSVLIGYVNFLDDAMMRNFRRDAKIQQATVVELQSARMDELRAVVDYPYTERNQYATTIRKTVKCKPVDVYRHLHEKHQKVKIHVELPGFSFDGSEATFDLPTKRFLEVMVYPGYPNSAVPRNVVTRTISLHKRLLTVIYVSIVGALAFLCIHLSHLLESLQLELMVFGLFVLLFLVWIHYGCGLRKSLKTEYLNDGAVRDLNEEETLGTITSEEDEVDCVSLKC